MPRAIGIDVGGTKIAAGIVDLETGEVTERREQPTRPERGGQAVLNDVIAIAESLLSDATCIGLGLAELVDREGRIASKATIDWMNLPVRERLEELLPTRIEADVRAAARGEARFGAGQGASSFLYVTVGTGISCALVIDGAPFLGARGLTGTFASAPTLVPLLDDRLEPGQPLEEFSSGVGVAKRFTRRANRVTDAKEVMALAKTGETSARRIAETSGRALGAAIAQLVNTLDPERVVIGGGLGCAGGVFHAAIKTAFYEHLWSDLHANIEVHIAKLGPDAGLIGAAVAAACA